jgi:glycosyltransferase involved in cell wall biosynthesis
MRIGQFTDSFLPIVDGVGRVVYGYANALSSRGHECYVITPISDAGFRGKYPFDIVDFYGVTIPEYTQYKMGIPLWDVHYHERIKSIKFDIVHVHSPFMSGFEGLRIAKKTKIPVVGTFHSKYYDDFLQVLKVQPLAEAGVKMVADFYEKCDDVWAVSENSAEALRSYGYKGVIKVMRNGTEIRKPDKKNISYVKSMYNLDDVPVILFVGQMNWKKNIIKVLEAVSILKKQGFRTKLILAGQGPHVEEIKKKITELDIMDLVEMVGHITDIYILDGLYGAADIFAFPSIYDNSPMVVREAAAMMTPSVLVRGSSAAEGITDGYNGFLCEDDSQDIADVFKKALFIQRDKIKEIGKNAQTTIPVSWDSIMSDVEYRYADLISQRKNNNKHKDRRKKILL